MPYDQSQSPWKNTRKRQDFSEALYLNITNTDNNNVQKSLYKVTMTTTAGYFELPNIEQSAPGPLLRNGPPQQHGSDYETQQWPQMKRQATTNSTAILNLESVTNKGPLLTIAMALFGEGSFIADRVFLPNFYLPSQFDKHLANEGEYGLTTVQPFHCQEMVPFARLLPNPDASGGAQVLGSCAEDNLSNIDDVVIQIAAYAALFQGETVDLKSAFNAAAFLTNEAWLTNLPNGVPCNKYVHYDLGADARKPSISITGIAVISVLLGIYLLCLFLLAMYSFLSPRWTSQLDSFAMMRIGAAMADEVPLRVSGNESKLEVLDRTPGFIGDGAGGQDGVGEIGLGLPGRLVRRKLYSSYE